jgi:hypothetical protein
VSGWWWEDLGFRETQFGYVSRQLKEDIFPYYSVGEEIQWFKCIDRSVRGLWSSKLVKCIVVPKTSIFCFGKLTPFSVE